MQTKATQQIKRSSEALTLIDVMVGTVVLLVVAAVLLPTLQRPRPSCRINCVNNLKQVGLAYRTWALDNNDRFPMQTELASGGTMELSGFGRAYVHFKCMSNELSTPKILLCPMDTKRTSATNFANDLDNTRISYFVGLSANPTNAQGLLSGDRNITNGTGSGRFLDLITNRPAGWNHELHNLVGNLGLADGSVQQLSTRRLGTVIADSGDQLNRLAMP